MLRQILESAEDSFILRWTSQSYEHVFNLSNFSGKVEKFDTDYNLQSITFYENGIKQVENQASAKTFTSGQDSFDYYLSCETVITCGCIGTDAAYCGCNGTYSQCVFTASSVCMLQNGGSGGVSTGTSGTGTSNSGGGNDAGSSSTTPSEALVEVVPNEPSNIIVNDKKCELFNNLKTNQSFKDIINVLKAGTTLTYEQGVALTNQTGGIFGAIMGVANPNKKSAVEFTIPDGSTIDIFIHNHYTGGLSIFSPDDLEQIYKVLKNPNITTGTNFVSIVVTPNEEVYAMTISDKDAFIAFGDKWFTNDDTYNEFNKLYSHSIADLDRYPGYGIKSNKPTNEQNFLRLLNSKNSGLKLHKANADLSQWTPLNLSKTNAVVPETPCN